MEVGTTTLYAILLLLVNGGVQWIREWRKHRTWSKNGKELNEIKNQLKTANGKIDCVDRKMGEAKVKIAEVKTAVNAQKEQCVATVKRFDEALRDQQKELLAQAKEKK